ncbi:MAG: monooxygenase FAD-binding protein [Chthoniobacteraceae bacterium]|nr:monooxygenase FAD-binding protein [Chthoniobacteraceae bacterium]
MDPLYDVAIIGGGPSGSTAATFLARQGHKVIVLEREQFPRFHIGESLLPHSMEAFERLGVVEKLDARFLPKYGAEITTSCGTNSAKIFFKDGLCAKHDRAYQVTRSEFDKLLLDHAAENGAAVLEKTSVESLDFGPDEVGINIKTEDETRKVRARYLLDCSGRGSIVGQYFKLKQNYANLKKFSVFAHYENVGRDEGITGSFIRLIRGSDRWFWMIPLTPTKMSIGIVLDIVDFKALKKAPEQVLEDAIREQPQIWSRMTNATRVTEVHSASDYSYRNTSLLGDRWLLAGDAAGFIDPIFSTGVFLGIRSGEQAAHALHAALKNPLVRAAEFRKYEKNVNRVMDLYLRFISNWYKPQFAEVITNPTHRLKLAATVNAVLAGNLSNSFSLWWRMEVFYLVVFLQRFFPLCPRVSLDPRQTVPSGAAN